jgi:hypothetical protein
MRHWGAARLWGGGGGLIAWTSFIFVFLWKYGSGGTIAVTAWWKCLVQGVEFERDVGGLGALFCKTWSVD